MAKYSTMSEEQRERIRERSRMYHSAHRVEKNAYSCRWYQENRERAAEYGRAYRAAHRKELKASNKVWRARNIVSIRKAQARKLLRYRQEVIKFFGGVCKVCGFSDYRALQLDHINGDGYKERDRTFRRDAWPRWKYIREHPKEALEKFQLLCANCNWIKRYEHNETANSTRDIS